MRLSLITNKQYAFTSQHIFNPTLMRDIHNRVCQASVRVPIGKPDSEFCKKISLPLVYFRKKQ